MAGRQATCKSKWKYPPTMTPCARGVTQQPPLASMTGRRRPRCRPSVLKRSRACTHLRFRPNACGLTFSGCLSVRKQGDYYQRTAEREAYKVREAGSFRHGNSKRGLSTRSSNNGKMLPKAGLSQGTVYLVKGFRSRARISRDLHKSIV